MKKIQYRNIILLFLTAFIWGSGFVAQSSGSNYAQPFTFGFVRCILGALVLFVFIKITDRRKPQGKDLSDDKKTLIVGGISCGVVLCIAMSLQQIGIEHTTVGKGGFITALYIILVPILGIFLKKRVGIQVWSSVALAAVGLYFLCITESVSIQTGDLYMLVCAIFFSVHILVIDYFSPKVDGVKMSCLQFFVCAILSGIMMLIFETPDVQSLLAGWFPILYAGVLSCGIAYTLQIVGQKGADPTIASLILSTEAVVSVLLGFLILHEKLTLRELLGCILMFGAIILAQLPGRNKS